MTATVLDMFRATVKNDADALALDPMLTVQRERAAVWATERLWGTTAPLRFDPEQRNRRMVAVGAILPKWGDLSHVYEYANEYGEPVMSYYN